MIKHLIIVTFIGIGHITFSGCDPWRKYDIPISEETRERWVDALMTGGEPEIYKAMSGFWVACERITERTDPTHRNRVFSHVGEDIIRLESKNHDFCTQWALLRRQAFACQLEYEECVDRFTTIGAPEECRSAFKEMFDFSESDLELARYCWSKEEEGEEAVLEEEPTTTEVDQ